jgi:hypothetical protein
MPRVRAYAREMRSDVRAGFLCCLSLGLLTAGCSSRSEASAGSPDTGPVLPTEDSAPAEDAPPGPGPTDAEPSSDAAGANTPDAGGPGDGGRDFSTDRSRFFGDSRCADAGVQLCEDFENGMIGPAWTVSGTKPVVDTMQHARGTHALHITQQGNGLSYIKEAMTFPEANDTYFGRVFVYFKSLPATLADGGMPYAHWTMLAASGTGVPGEIRVSGQLQNGRNLFGVGTTTRRTPGRATGRTPTTTRRALRPPFRSASGSAWNGCTTATRARPSSGGTARSTRRSRPPRACTGATRTRTSCPSSIRSGWAGRSTRRAASSSSCGSTRLPSIRAASGASFDHCKMTSATEKWTAMGGKTSLICKRFAL